MSLQTALTRMTNAVKARLAQYLSLKNVIGAENVKGTMYRNVFSGFISSFGTGTGPGLGEGDLALLPTLANDSNVYLHFRLPMNTDIHSRMFYLNFKGYSFGTGVTFDIKVGGYCYQATGQLLNTNVLNANLTTAVYKDANNNIVVSILFPSSYFTTIELESMIVGNGVAMRHGDVACIVSKNSAALFPKYTG